MIIKEGHYVGTGSYTATDTDKILPIECVFDVVSIYPDFRINGYWHHHDGTPKTKIEATLATTEALFVYNLLVYYGERTFKGKVGPNREPGIAILHSSDKEAYLGVSIAEIKGGFSVSSIYHGEATVHWHVDLFAHDPVSAKENVVSLSKNA